MNIKIITVNEVQTPPKKNKTYDSIYIILWKMQPNLYGWKADLRLPKKTGKRKGLQGSTHKESFESDGQVHYIECTYGFVRVYRHQNLYKCSLKISLVLVCRYNTAAFQTCA